MPLEKGVLRSVSVRFSNGDTIRRKITGQQEADILDVDAENGSGYPIWHEVHQEYDWPFTEVFVAHAELKRVLANVPEVKEAYERTTDEDGLVINVPPTCILIALVTP